MLMTKKLQPRQFAEIAKAYDIPLINFKKVLKVESNEAGFSAKTGKIIIQFEPRWMLRFLGIGKGKAGTWVNNGVGNQTVEWLAFNAAFKVNKSYAMQSTSIGMGQILGLHYKRLGFRSVGSFWDYNKKGEQEQVECVAKFIITDNRLYKALATDDFDTFAYYYNGADYLTFNYANRLREADV